jgi:hypothetical protein
MHRVCYIDPYPSLVAQLRDLFQRAETVDQECLRINSAASTGERRRLLGVELTARGLEQFTIATPSVAKDLRLPDWLHGDRLAWPPPQPSLAVLMAASMIPQYDARFSADWAAAREANNVRRQQNDARWREEEAARQESSRQVYEASLKR